jgi:hypothetical protein
MQQRTAKVVLEAPDLLAHGRLGAVNTFASAGKAAGLDDRDKPGEQIEIEHLTRVHSDSYWKLFQHLIFK